MSSGNNSPAELRARVEPNSAKEERLVLANKMEESSARRRRSWPPEVDQKEPVAGIFVTLDPDISGVILNSDNGCQMWAKVENSGDKNERNGVSFESEGKCCQSAINFPSEQRRFEAAASNRPHTPQVQVKPFLIACIFTLPSVQFKAHSH